jgi:hypothetical protein
MSNVGEYGGSNHMGSRTSTHIRWMSGVQTNSVVGVAGEVETSAHTCQTSGMVGAARFRSSEAKQVRYILRRTLWVSLF